MQMLTFFYANFFTPRISIDEIIQLMAALLRLLVLNHALRSELFDGVVLEKSKKNQNELKLQKLFLFNHQL